MKLDVSIFLFLSIICFFTVYSFSNVPSANSVILLSNSFSRDWVNTSNTFNFWHYFDPPRMLVVCHTENCWFLFVSLLRSSKWVTMLFAADPMTTEFLDSLLPGALSKAPQKGNWVTWTSFTSGMFSLTPSGLPLLYVQVPRFLGIKLMLADLKPFKLGLSTL